MSLSQKVLDHPFYTNLVYSQWMACITYNPSPGSCGGFCRPWTHNYWTFANFEQKSHLKILSGCILRNEVVCVGGGVVEACCSLFTFVS